MKKIKVALIGCGRIAYKHIEAILDLDEKLELVAVCDVLVERAEEKADLAAKRTQCAAKPKVYIDYREMIEREDFEVGIVATESGHHYCHVMDLLKAKKHVLVEKPIALSTKDADEMISFAKEQGVLLTVSHQNRFNSPVQALRKAVTDQRFGKMINGTARILWTRDQGYYQQAPWRGTAEMDGGTLMNQCIHNIDLLIWMMNSPVKSVYAQTGTFLRNIEMEDFGAILLRFESGAIGIVEGSACVYPKNLEETLSLFGETGTVVIGGLAVNEIQTWNFQNNSEEDAEVLNLKDSIDSVYGNGHAKLYENLYQALTLGTPLLIDGESGSQAMKVILAAYKSQAEGMPVDVKDLEYSTRDFVRGDQHEHH